MEAPEHPLVDLDDLAAVATQAVDGRAKRDELAALESFVERSGWLGRAHQSKLRTR